MTTYIPTYLRPISDTHTGNQSLIDLKADDVESVVCPCTDNISFKQINPFLVWGYADEHHRAPGTAGARKTKVERDVDTPERHWWVITEEVFDSIEPALRSHPDIFDFLIALNLCIDDPVYFSQSPGQTVGGAYSLENGALSYMSDLSLGNIATGLLGLNEIPREIAVENGVMDVFRQVRKYRSKKIETDEEIDIRLALHMYEDALSATMWTAISNFYFVCENVLASGYGSNDQLISENTSLGLEEARTWRKVVNRIKHPDKGENVDGILDREDTTIPSQR